MTDQPLPTQPCLTAAETDLLRAAFLAQPMAADAWRRWSADIDWDGYLDHTSFALLPRAYRNLRSFGIDDPIFPRCKGIMHQAWLGNQRMIKGLGTGLDALAGAGIAPVLAPPTWLLTRDRTVVLDRAQPLFWAIAPAQAEAAVAVLLGLGWRLQRLHLPRWSLAGYIAGARHIVLRAADGPPWLLTWGLAELLDGRDALSAAEPRNLGGQRVLALTTRDALAFTLAQPRGRGLFPLAAELLGIAASEVHDWPEPRAEPGPLPAHWNRAMDQIAPLLAQWGAPAGFGRVIEAAPSITAAASRNPLRRLTTDWQGYRAALGASVSTVEPLRQLPGYLLGRWRLQHPRQLLGRALRWLLPRRRD